MNKTELNRCTHPRSILVATNLTDLERLLPYAKSQGATTGAMLWLVHVLETSTYGEVMSGVNSSIPDEVAYRSAQAVLTDAITELRGANLACRYEIFCPPIEEHLAKFAQDKKIDRFIQGSSGKGALGKCFLGSVAEAMIRTLDIPVCTIGPKATGNPDSTLRTVLLATSLRHRRDERSQLILAEALANETRAHVGILHVMQTGESGISQLSAAVKAMDALAGSEHQGRAKSHVFVRLGDPAEEILRETVELKPVALVLGVEHITKLASAVRSGTVHQMVSQAPCPVFTLRNTDR